MNGSGPSLAQHLYRLSPALEDPVAIARAVADYYDRAGWAPVTDAELEAVMADSLAMLQNPATYDGMSSRYKWRLGHFYMKLLHARADRASLSVTGLTDAIRVALDTHDERMAQMGFDRFAERRERNVDLLGRLLRAAHPQEWELTLLEGPPPAPETARFALRIRNLRTDHGFSVAQLAVKVGVDRSTVTRWEEGKLVPDATHRAALAKALGGRPGDYAGGT
jgi:DNA-binding XRE family transcriptional regulator